MRYYAAPQEQQLAPRPDAAGRFGRIAVTLGFDEPTFFGQRHDPVLAVIERASEMSAAELATLCAAQSAHTSFAAHRVVLSPQWKVAHGRLAAEARDAGRLALVGRERGETSSPLMRSLGKDHGGTATRLAGCALAGELVWTLIDDVAPQRVLQAGDETVLRGSWQQMLLGTPAPAPEPSAPPTRSERFDRRRTR